MEQPSSLLQQQYTCDIIHKTNMESSSKADSSATYGKYYSDRSSCQWLPLETGSFLWFIVQFYSITLLWWTRIFWFSTSPPLIGKTYNMGKELAVTSSDLRGLALWYLTSSKRIYTLCPTFGLLLPSVSNILAYALEILKTFCKTDATNLLQVCWPNHKEIQTFQSEFNTVAPAVSSRKKLLAFCKVGEFSVYFPKSGLLKCVLWGTDDACWGRKPTIFRLHKGSCV